MWFIWQWTTVLLLCFLINVTTLNRMSRYHIPAEDTCTILASAMVICLGLG